jgi:phosphate:Na+ symporter
MSALDEALTVLTQYSPQLAGSIREKEEKTDHYEDILATYLVRLSTRPISAQDSTQAAKLLKIIGDFERIADHAVNLLESAEEMQEKNVVLTETAASELRVICGAVEEIAELSLTAYLSDDRELAFRVEPLEQVIDQLKEQLRTRHILRMQQGGCPVEVGFIWSDLLTDLERSADHCSNIAGCVLEMDQCNMNLHETLRDARSGSTEFQEIFRIFADKYTLPANG